MKLGSIWVAILMLKTVGNEAVLIQEIFEVPLHKNKFGV
jgi:hypothetical protein